MNVEIQEGFAELEVIIRCPQVTEEVQRMAQLLQSSAQRLTGTLGGATHLIDTRDVLYFESVDKHCFIYTSDEVYETSLKLYEIEEMLVDKDFIRSAKSQILNIARIESLCPDFGGRIEVVLDDGEKLIVSRQYARSLKERLCLK